MKNHLLPCLWPALVWLLPLVAQAQISGNKVWDTRFGGSNQDHAHALVQAPDGGYLVAGYSRSGADGDKSESSQGNDDYWVVKLDEDGIKVWDRRFGGTGQDYVKAIVAAPGGGYVLAGSSYSTLGGDKTQPTQGSWDYWLVKIDEDGNKIWDKTFGGSTEDRAEAIVAASGGGYIVAGWSNSGVGGTKTQPSQGGFDYWLVKIDENGNKIWDTRFGGTNWDYATSIIRVSGGCYVVAGRSVSGMGGDKSQSSRGDYDYWLIKINENGNKLWDQTFGGSDNDQATALVAAPTGGCVVAGYSNSGATWNKSQPSQGHFDYWLVKVDDNGTKVWDQRFGSTTGDYARAILAAPGGGYVVAGESESSTSADKTEPSRGSYDYWLVKIDENGNKLWDQTFGGSEADQPYALVSTPAGGSYIVAGWSESGSGADKTQASQGDHDYWVVKFNDCTSALPVFQLQSSGGVGVCPNTPVTLSAVSDSVYTYTWQPGNFTGSSLNLIPTQTTVYTVVAQAAGGCPLYQTIQVIVAQPEMITVDLALHFGDTLTLDAGPGLEYRWVATGQNTRKIQITEPGTYFVSVDYGDCAQRIRYVVDTLEVVSGVSGKAYFDLNQNGQFDGEEPLIANRMVYLLEPSGNWAGITSTDSTGFYWIPWPAAGSYRVKVQQISSASPSIQPNPQGEYTETIASVAETRTERNFGFKPYRDVAVTLFPVGFFRPGFDYRVRVQYCNIGTLPIASGTITVALDSLLEYTGQTVFSYTDLQPGECRSFDLTGIVPVDTQTQLGATVRGSATITPLNDDQPENNTDTFVGVIQGAYDPNDKTAFIEARTSGDYALEGETIEYRIRFQNTGTDTAFSVVVRDTLDHTKLDLTTLELIATSHPARFTLRGAGIAVWQFPNILLPDSNTNEPLSHGFIRFRVKTRTQLGCDATTANRVSIYFDFNDPVLTNDATTHINPTPELQILVPEHTATTATFRAEVLTFGQNLTWDFGPDATPQTATGAGPHGVVFATEGSKTVRLSANSIPTCANTVEKTFTPGTSRAAETENRFTLSPNPTTGQLYLTFPQPVSGTLRVLDALGKVVLTQPLTQATTATFDLTGQPAGVYVVQALGQTAKVVLTR
jgi:hypothetical protein